MGINIEIEDETPEGCEVVDVCPVDVYEIKETDHD